MQENRRTNIRKSTSDYFLIYDLNTNELIGRIIDLTTEGTMIISDSPVQVPNTQKCRIAFPEKVGLRREMFVETETKWCQENSRCNWYEVGLKFINLQDEDLETITEMIEDWKIKKDKKTSKDEISF